jgi:hypothetical protein
MRRALRLDGRDGGQHPDIGGVGLPVRVRRDKLPAPAIMVLILS